MTDQNRSGRYGRKSLLNDSGGRSHCDDPVRQRSGDNCACSDHAVRTDIRHNHGVRTNPASSADPHDLTASRLLANRSIGVRRSVCVRTAGNVDARGQQDVLLKNHPTEMTAGTDVDVFSNYRVRLGEQSPKANPRRRMTFLQDQRIERRTEITAG